MWIAHCKVTNQCCHYICRLIYLERRRKPLHRMYQIDLRLSVSTLGLKCFERDEE